MRTPAEQTRVPCRHRRKEKPRRGPVRLRRGLRRVPRGRAGARGRPRWETGQAGLRRARAARGEPGDGAQANVPAPPPTSALASLKHLPKCHFSTPGHSPQGRQRPKAGPSVGAFRALRAAPWSAPRPCPTRARQGQSLHPSLTARGRETRGQITCSWASVRAESSSPASAPGSARGMSRRAEASSWGDGDEGQWQQTELHGNRLSHMAALLRSWRNRRQTVSPLNDGESWGVAPGPAPARELPADRWN